MDRLPTEILKAILGSLIDLSQSSKNDILPLRLVCQDFNVMLRQDLLKTVQLDFSRLAKNERPLDLKYLDGVAQYCEAIYIDLMIMRDEGWSLLLLYFPQSSQICVSVCPPTL